MTLKIRFVKNKEDKLPDSSSKLPDAYSLGCCSPNLPKKCVTRKDTFGLKCWVIGNRLELNESGKLEIKLIKLEVG